MGRRRANGRSGWSTELTHIPVHYWVSLPGYERAPTIAEIELHDGVLKILHERLDGPRGWVPLEQEYGPEHEAEWWGPLVPPE